MRSPGHVPEVGVAGKSTKLSPFRILVPEVPDRVYQTLRHMVQYFWKVNNLLLAWCESLCLNLPVCRYDLRG